MTMAYKTVDLIIHIDEELDDTRIHEIEKSLIQNEGVHSACVHEKARHLMLVDYDPDDVASGQLLEHVQAQGFHAELVGI